MVWYEAIDTSRCLETESEPAVLVAEFVYHTVRGLVQGAERKPFEVFAFGMMQANGMIDRLAELTHDPDAHFAELRAVYDQGPPLSVPPTVFNAVRNRAEAA